MPPVMGAGAFVMSEMTGIPYVDIIKVAAIPGLLYFLSVGVMIYFESKKLGLRGLPRKSCRAAVGGLEARLVSLAADRRVDRRDACRLFAAVRGVLRHRLHHRRQLVSQRDAHGPERNLAGSRGRGKKLRLSSPRSPARWEFSLASCRSRESSFVFRTFWWIWQDRAFCSPSA